MDLSIIIINWNSAKHVEKCIQSIFAHNINLKYEIIIVDNASYDGCNDVINEFKGILYIQSNKNLGFGKANNYGVQYSTGKTLLFLNPDTKVLENAIEVMYNHLELLPDAGAIGCKILNPDGSIQSSCVQKYPTLINQIMDSDYLKLHRSNIPIFEQTEPVRVEAVSGACLMIKREVFEKVGGFTPAYFMYTEDVDICYKVKETGLKIYYLGIPRIIHYGSGSSKKHESNFGDVMMRESIFKYFQMRKGQLSATIYRISMLISSLIRISIIFLIFIPLKSSDEYLYSMHKWRSILRWSLGCEKWVSNLK